MAGRPPTDGNRPLASPNVADILARLRARADAARVRCLAQPPVPPSRIRALADECGGLPDEVTDLMSASGGLEFGSHVMGFSGPVHFGTEPPAANSPWRLFPRHLVIARPTPSLCVLADMGNRQQPGTPVFGLWGSPPVVMLLAPSLAGYLTLVARMLPVKSDGSDWDLDPLQPSAQVMTGVHKLMATDGVGPVTASTPSIAEPLLAAYASQFAPGTLFADLRALSPGSGFAWGGRRQIDLFHRHPSELIMAMSPAEWSWSLRRALTGGISSKERKRCLKLFEQASN